MIEEVYASYLEVQIMKFLKRYHRLPRTIFRFMLVSIMGFILQSCYRTANARTSESILENGSFSTLEEPVPEVVLLPIDLIMSCPVPVYGPSLPPRSRD